MHINSIYHLPSASPPPCPTGCLKFCTLPVLFSPQTGKKQDGMLAFFRCPCYPLRPLHCLKITEKSVKKWSTIHPKIIKNLDFGGLGGLLEAQWEAFGGLLVPFGPKRASRAEKVVLGTAPGPPFWTTFGVHFRSRSVQDRFLGCFFDAIFRDPVFHWFLMISGSQNWWFLDVLT